MIEIGDTAVLDFVITQRDMELFQELSGDYSRIHIDDEYASECGYGARIVYGGILLSKLSCLLGSKIPGDFGVSMSWKVNFRSPLLVGEMATLTLIVENVSVGVGVVESSFEITSGKNKVASGSTQSIIPSGISS